MLQGITYSKKLPTYGPKIAGIFKFPVYKTLIL